MRPIMPNWPSTEFPKDAARYSGSLRRGPFVPMMRSACDLPAILKRRVVTARSRRGSPTSAKSVCPGLFQPPSERMTASAARFGSTAPTTACWIGIPTASRFFLPRREPVKKIGSINSTRFRPLARCRHVGSRAPLAGIPEEMAEVRRDRRRNRAVPLRRRSCSGGLTLPRYNKRTHFSAGRCATAIQHAVLC